MRAGWTLPYIAPSGEIYTLSATVRGDFYNTTKLGELQDSYTPTEDGVHARAIPEISMEWSYPFVRRDGDLRTIVEPIGQVVASPVYGSQNRFPNEDSRAVNFDDTNLFRTDRFDGLDRVEGGERVNYGVKTTFLRNNGMRAGTFFGQSYRFQNSSAFPDGSGLENNSSNYVGSVYMSPHPWFSSRYAFQLSRADFSTTRETVSASVGPPAVRLGATYILVDKRSLSTLTDDVEQIGGTLDLRLNEHWRTQGRYLTSLSSDAGSLLWGGNLVYEDECIVTILDLTRRYVGTAAAPPDTAVFVRLLFRNLGEIAQNVF
jgi:LPS-assembly protein